MTSFDISYKNLTTLIGIEFPGNIETLYCNNNKLTSLNGCPSTVKHMYCSNNLLKTLFGCPDSILELHCGFNKLKSLFGCPDSVLQLHCGFNKLKSLKGISKSVTKLFCNNNRLTSLKYLPSSIKYLFCGINRLTSLKYCHHSIVTLDSLNNKLDYGIFYSKMEYTFHDANKIAHFQKINISRFSNLILNFKHLKNQRIINKLWNNYWYDTLIKIDDYYVNRLCLCDMS